MSARPRLLLSIAAVAVAFAAADTYVVVLALPDMMASVGVPLDQLQRAAPIVSGFLLGYVAMLPLIGRIADLRGRLPVLVASLVLFAAGSLVTALSYDMGSLVAGRFLQGVGGGGLIPATLALVADLYPVDRRGVPLGIVSGVQELGSVVGPLFGAVVLAVASWRAIFAINLVAGIALALAVRRAGWSRPGSATENTAATDSSVAERSGPHGPPDWIGALLLLVTLAAGGLVFLQPPALLRDITWGTLFVPWAGSNRWLTPVGAAAVLALALLLVRCWTARRPLVDVRAWLRAARDADLVGALFLAIALSGVILAFATADPKVEVFAPQGLWYLLASALATVALVLHLRRDRAPLIPRGAIAERAAWGSLAVSFFAGAALIAALIDIPIFARTTVYSDSQLLAALVLVRFLVALPVGAVVGGFLTRRLPSGLVAALGLLLAAGGFVLMSHWGLETLSHVTANVSLLLGGFGFGLALAPVNAAVLASTRDDVHGLASALVVVARMVGMLVGISGLTTIGLRRYYAETRGLPAPMDVCGGGTSRCDAFDNLLRHAGIAQEQTVFAGAAVCAVVGAALALVLLRGAATRTVATDEVLRASAG